MKTTEENIDQIIKEALNQEEADFYDNLGEQSMPEMMTGLFKGKMKWWTVLIFAFSFIFFGLSLYCAVQFFQVEDLRMMIIYGAGSFMFMMAVTMLKLWSWMQMDKNAILRELKRIELQVSLLSNKSIKD